VSDPKADIVSRPTLHCTCEYRVTRVPGDGRIQYPAAGTVEPGLPPSSSRSHDGSQRIRLEAPAHELPHRTHPGCVNSRAATSVQCVLFSGAEFAFLLLVPCPHCTVHYNR